MKRREPQSLSAWADSSSSRWLSQPAQPERFVIFVGSRSTATVLRVPGTAAAITQPVRQRGTASRASEAAPAASPVAAPAATPVKAARKKPGRPPGRKKVGRPAGRPKGRVGRRKGSGTRALEALSFVQGQPGITIPELAGKMGIKQNYLYRVLPGLEQNGKLEKKGRGWHPRAA